jgi:hypothetical protein
VQGDGSSGDDLVAQFARWSAGQRADDAARSRSRERSLREQAVSSATWSGALLDLAEARSAVTVSVGSARLSGTLEAVGADFCVLRAGRRPVLVRLARLVTVWPEARAPRHPPAGSRFPSLELSMAAALSMLAEDRVPVTLRLTGDQFVSGDLVAVGEDIVTLREPEGARRSALVPLEAVEYCELR